MRKTLSECQQCIESWSLMATEKFLLSPDRPPVELWPWCASSVISPLYNICILRCAVKSRCHNRRPSMDGTDPIGGAYNSSSSRWFAHPTVHKGRHQFLSPRPWRHPNPMNRWKRFWFASKSLHGGLHFGRPFRHHQVSPRYTMFYTPSSI